MAFEKRWAAIAPIAFTADGTPQGQVTVASTADLHVKQKVYLSATNQPSIILEIKSVLSDTTFVVGPSPGSITATADISAYTVAFAAMIYALEQPRPAIPLQEINRAVFEEEPAVAVRAMLVDDLGNPYSSTNPLPSNAQLTGAVGITDGTNSLSINTDGSINVNTVISPDATPGIPANQHDSTALPPGSEITLLTLVAPPNGYKVYKIDVSGENIALYRVKVNGTAISLQRTSYTNYNARFTFEPFTNGYELLFGQTLTVTVLHNRPYTGNFEAALMGVAL